MGTDDTWDCCSNFVSELPAISRILILYIQISLIDVADIVIREDSEKVDFEK